MDVSVLPDLYRCLETSSWRRLLAMMASHGLPCSTRWKKAALVQTLHTHLSQPDIVSQLVARLSQPAQDALAALLRADGSLPASTFTATFGPIRPYRPWRKEAEPQQPWLNPASPTERLWYLGLLHLLPRRPSPGETQRAILPAELRDELALLLLRPQSDQPVRLRARPGASPDLLWDTALFLATLEENPIRPLHGRWLPPRVLATLAGRMGLDRHPDFRPRSERKIPYLAFVHYLAQAAGLLSGPNRLGLTASAWHWLAADPPTRWQRLWQGWLNAPAELAAPFRFPWSPLVRAARKLVLTEVSQLPLDRFLPLAQVVAQAHLHDDWKRLAQPWDIEQDIVATLIIEPLHWFGIVTVGEKGQEDSTPNPASIADSSPEDTAETPPTIPDLLVRLTPLGAWLLELPDCGPPSFTPSEPCSIRPPNYDQILVPPTAQPLHLARLAPLCDWQPAEPPAPEQRLLLTKERVGAAVAHGMALSQIFHQVEAALGQSPSRRQQQRLRRWAATGQQVRVRHVTLLETAAPQLMGNLRSRKLIRRHLGEALSPTRSELNPAGVPALLKTLRNMDLYASPPPEIAPTASQPAGQEPGTPAPGTVELSAAEASLLLASAQVYAGLGAHAELPLSIPAQTIHTLQEQLAPAHREAAEHAARRVIEQIEAALQGYLALPAWHIHHDPERTVPALEAAIANQHDLVLTYQGAVREQVTVRRVTPYWLEKRHTVLYLNAYCHLREDERVFRVDRIIKCQGVK